MNDKLKSCRLSEDELDGVAGGYIFDSDSIPGSGQRWEVIDQKGDRVAAFESKGEAENFARAMCFDTKEINYDELLMLRGSR